MRSIREAFTCAAGVAGLTAASMIFAPAPASAGVARTPTVLNLGQIARQEVEPATGSEPDTLVEPDIAASPANPNIAVAAAHEGRYPDGGAVAITHAWTRNGGLTWRHAPVRFITKATGGVWDRASDPVLAFAPNGDVYLSTIALNTSADDCNSVVLVSRSTDGGATFAPPVTAQATNDCNLFNDKNWLAIDNGVRSPHRGRLYQFWSYFQGDFAQQRVRWSDDQGRTWSAAVVVTPGQADTQNSQVLIAADGSITDVYLDLTGTGRENDRERESAAARRSAAEPPDEPAVPLRARTSTDGGRTWSAAVTVANDVGGEVPGVRCCLPSATIDPVSDRMYAVWQSTDNSLLRASSSADGVHWTAPVTVNAERTAGTQIVNADVAAYRGRVLVSYGIRNTAVADGRYVRQKVAVSYDSGRSFRARLRLGPPSDLRYAAQANGAFPGDYIGTAASRGRFYAAWALSSKPPSGGTYHQVLLAAALRP